MKSPFLSVPLLSRVRVCVSFSLFSSSFPLLFLLSLLLLLHLRLLLLFFLFFFPSFDSFRFAAGEQKYSTLARQLNEYGRKLAPRLLPFYNVIP